MFALQGLFASDCRFHQLLKVDYWRTKYFESLKLMFQNLTWSN